MNKKGLFFDMMIAVMMILGIMVVIVGLFTSLDDDDPYIDFSKHANFGSEYSRVLLQTQVAQQQKVDALEVSDLSAVVSDNLVQDFTEEEKYYVDIVEEFYSRIDISSQIDELNFSYYLNDTILNTYSKGTVDYTYNSNTSNISISRPIHIYTQVSEPVALYMDRLVDLEELFTQKRKCVLTSTVCDHDTIEVERSIISIEKREVLTTFTDLVTHLQAKSVDVVSPAVIESLSS